MIAYPLRLTGGEHRVVSAEFERVDGLFVRAEAGHNHRRGNVPDENGGVRAARSQVAAARRELEHVDGTLQLKKRCFTHKSSFQTFAIR